VSVVNGLGAFLGAPVQVAYVVSDVEAAAHAWCRDFGAGPFFVRRHIELVDVMYRGRPGTFDHSSAYGQWGSLMVELIVDHGSSESPIRDVYGPGETGLHHLAFVVDNLHEVAKSQVALGCRIAMSARTAGGTQFHFVDTMATHGHMLELYERSERLRKFYSQVAAAAQEWNGDEPVRTLA
jgi:hypothetical protein